MKRKFLDGVYAGYQVMRFISTVNGKLIRCRFTENGAIVWYFGDDRPGE